MIDDIIKLITDTILNELKGSMGIAMQIAALAFICAAIKGIETGTGREIARAAFFVQYAMTAALLCSVIVSMRDTAINSIENMVNSMNGVSPVLLTAAATLGNFTAVSGMGGMFVIATGLVANLIKNIFLPGAIILAVLNIVENLSDTIKLGNLTSLVKNVLLWGMGIVMTLYIGILSVQSLIAGTSDGAINKTVKFAAGSLIPFVGQYLSDSLDAVSASALAINGAAGTGAMIAIITISVGPAVKILITAGILKLSSAVIQPVADERISSAVGGTAAAFSLIAGITAVCAVIFTITIGALLNTMSAVIK